MKQKQIRNIRVEDFEGLIRAVTIEGLTDNQNKEMLMAAIGCMFIFTPETTEEIETVLRDWWKVWKDKPERPIFINLDISVKS